MMETSQPTNTAYEPPQAPQPEGSPLTGKRILIILGILVLLLVIVLAVAGKNQPPASQPSVQPTLAEASPTPDSTGVYTNPTTGVSFTYPPQVKVNNVSSDIISVSSNEGPLDPDAPVTGMQISIFAGNKVADQLDLVKDLFTNPSIKDITINGVAGKEISGLGKGVFQGKFIKFVEVYNGKNTYEISYFEGEPYFTKADFDQILASFTVTK